MTPDQLDALAATWIVLARIFAAAPDQQTFDSVRSDDLLDDWPLPVQPKTKEGLDLLRASLAEDESLQDVKDDHFTLIVGPGKMKAAPWESVYRSEEKLLFEEETLQVRQFYRRFGLQAPKLNREPDDHISLELEFCATLLTRAMDALDAQDPDRAAGYQDAHKDFCLEHLFAWAPEFFELVESGAETKFYRGFGALGTDALAQAKEWVG